MKPGQSVTNAIGNIIGEEKRDLLDKVKADVPIELAMSQFVFNVAYQLAQIAERAKPQPAQK